MDENLAKKIAEALDEAIAPPKVKGHQTLPQVICDLEEAVNLLYGHKRAASQAVGTLTGIQRLAPLAASLVAISRRITKGATQPEHVDLSETFERARKKPDWNHFALTNELRHNTESATPPPPPPAKPEAVQNNVLDEYERLLSEGSKSARAAGKYYSQNADEIVKLQAERTTLQRKQLREKRGY